MRRLFIGIAVMLLGLLVLPAFADDKDKKDPAPAPDVKKDAAPAPDVKKDAAPDVKKDPAPAPDVKKDAAPDVKKDPAPDAKKDPAPDAKKDPAPDAPPAEKLIKLGEKVGKIVEVNGTKKSLRLQIGYEVQKLNVGEVQAMQNDKIQLAQAMAQRQPDINQIRNLEVSMVQHQARMYTTERKTQDVEVMSTDDVKVRMTTPPVAYDDKGNVKKYTNKELKELKGDPKDPDSKLPGYPGDFSNLRNDQMVKVSLVKKKDAPKPVGPKPKDADPDLAGENEPLVSMIEILAEPPAK